MVKPRLFAEHTDGALGERLKTETGGTTLPVTPDFNDWDDGSAQVDPERFADLVNRVDLKEHVDVIKRRASRCRVGLTRDGRAAVLSAGAKWSARRSSVHCPSSSSLKGAPAFVVATLNVNAGNGLVLSHALANCRNDRTAAPRRTTPWSAPARSRKGLDLLNLGQNCQVHSSRGRRPASQPAGRSEAQADIDPAEPAACTRSPMRRPQKRKSPSRWTGF